MPIYEYVCGACGHTDDEYHAMGKTLVVCPLCHQAAYNKQISLPHTDLKEFHKPIEMMSIAMQDREEIRRFAQQCPNVRISDDPADPNYGIPVAPNRKAKLQALKAAGFQEINSERIRR